MKNGKRPVKFTLLLDDNRLSQALYDCPSKVKVLALLFLASRTSAAAYLSRVSYVRSAVQWAFLRWKCADSHGFRGRAGYGVVRHYDWSLFLTGQSPAVFL